MAHNTNENSNKTAILCQRMVAAGYRVRHIVRCEMPEHHEVHDPLGPVGRHPFDPVPACPEDDQNGS